MKRVRIHVKKVGKNTLDSLTLFKAALRSNPDALKGLDNLTLAISLNKKLMEVTPGESQPFPVFLDLTPSEYDLLRKSVDKMQWGPVILDFEEFIDSIKYPEDV